MISSKITAAGWSLRQEYLADMVAEPFLLQPHCPVHNNSDRRNRGLDRRHDEESSIRGDVIAAIPTGRRTSESEPGIK